MDFTVGTFTDLGLALAAAAVAVVAAAEVLQQRADGVPRRRWLLVGLAAVLAARFGLAGVLAAQDWALGARRLQIALPLAALGLAVAALAPRRAERPAYAALAAATAASLLDVLVLPGAAGTAVLVASVPLAALATVGRLPLRLAASGLAAAVTLSLVGSAWWGSRLPATYDLAAFAPVDDGGSSADQDGHGGPGTSVADLTGPRTGRPDVRVELTASRVTQTDATGNEREALAFNGTVPGPTIRARKGDLLEVVLRNRDVADGVSVHWHGYDVPNAEDGVAGVTQDAVRPGGEHVYRFRAEQVGTYWYHSHQSSSVQVQKGLYGGLVVTPREPAPVGEDVLVTDHAWRGTGGFTTGATYADRVERLAVQPGTEVRLRLVNTDSLPRRYWLSGTEYAVAAVDGYDLKEAPALIGGSLLLAGGGRYDLAFLMPEGPVVLDGLGQRVRLVLGSGTPGNRPTEVRDLDLARYGTPAEPAPSSYDRDFTLTIDRRLAFRGGRPGYHWSVNGGVYPRMPMLMVREGDNVRMTIVNRTTAHHPMHLHGHRVLVQERNGRRVSGSPWQADSLNIAPGERYVVSFVADNPGIWMNHCHDLRHAADGFVMHLAYEGVRTPFSVGGRNTPE